MLLKTLVKVSINNLSDARYCASMGVQMIGLPIDPGQTPYITPSQFKELTQWVHGVKLVGELNGPDLNTIQETLNNYQLDYLQLNHLSNRPIPSHLQVPLLMRVSLQGSETLEELTTWLGPYGSSITYFVIEALVNDSATVNKLQKYVKQLAKTFPIIQGFNLTPRTLGHLLKDTALQGFALQGGIELKPGYKDFENLSNLLALLIIDPLRKGC
jgi:phosphoribosylanthranilate isomerase